MKQVVQNYKSGELSLLEVPPPRVRPGGVLVHNICSLISAGTERGMVELGRKNLLQKARARPDQVRKVMDKARTEGFLSTYRKAMQRLEAPMALGYSCAGTVIAVGAGVTDLEVGDPVACGGIGYASHAEIVFVPRNLCVKVPVKAGAGNEGNAVKLTPASPAVAFAEAAYTTLGAIALEGVRVADARLGETIVVLGLGLVGLLTVQILKAGGCRVIGLDLNPSRCQLALELGCDLAAVPAKASDLVRQMTGGDGADGVLITAATSSSEPVRLAGELARDRGRVVIVGIVGMEVPYKLYYEKALELRLSRSYGPGRYDRFYEEKGYDYPLAYVRWTENRNMESFLQLVADGKVQVDRLTTHRYPVDQALEAYGLITQGKEPHIGVIIQYPETSRPGRRVPVQSPGASADQPVQVPKAPAAGQAVPGVVSVGVIGAGNFTSGVLLQAMRKIDGVELRGICSQGGLRARAAADRFGFAYCTSDAEELCHDPQIQAILVTTRPSSHADLVILALENGKQVFVEKPLAVNLEQLQKIVQQWEAGKRDVLMVGFNRRFSPYGQKLREFFQDRSTPLVASYRVNAGALPKRDWQQDLEEGGGRIIGEVGHFVDFLSYLIGAPPESVTAQAIGGTSGSVFSHDNVSLTMRFRDGSLGTIIYVSEGAASFPKERVEVFGGGAVGVIDDFRRLELVKGGRRRVQRGWLNQDKGHRQELAAFVEAIRRGEAGPVSLEDYLLTTLCTFQAVKSLQTGLPQPVSLSLLTQADEPVEPANDHD
jgi:predicted dehydrogenase/threonine dehydrogenase-like Zn-dependent dehydrogenase